MSRLAPLVHPSYICVTLRVTLSAPTSPPHTAVHAPFLPCSALVGLLPLLRVECAPRVFGSISYRLFLLSTHVPALSFSLLQCQRWERVTAVICFSSFLSQVRELKPAEVKPRTRIVSYVIVPL